MTFNPYSKETQLRGKKRKEPYKGIKPGKKVLNWELGRQKLKATFRENGIMECEINLENCKRKNYLGFAHIVRRVELTEEEIVSPHFVVLACQNCHDTVDNRMPKKDSYPLLFNIVKSRGW